MWFIRELMNKQKKKKNSLQCDQAPEPSFGEIGSNADGRVEIDRIVVLHIVVHIIDQIFI